MLKTILHDYVIADAKKWKHNRTLTIGASEIGGCARRSWYSKKQASKDDDHIERWGATRRGDLIEQHLVVPALAKKYGSSLLWAGKKQKTFLDKWLSATPDGLIKNLKANALAHLGVKDIGPGKCILIEIKSIDPRANISVEKRQHRYQTQVQMGLVREQTDYRPEYALIVYVDASFHDEINEFVVKFEPKVYATAKRRAQDILTAKKPKELAPEGYIAGGGECDNCAWKDACGIERHALPSEKWKDKPVDPQRVAEMEDMCRAAKQYEAARDEADAKLKTQQEAIRTRLREWDIRKVPGVVALASVKGRSSYDNEGIRAAAQAAGVDIEKFSRVGESTSRLTISLSTE